MAKKQWHTEFFDLDKIEDDSNLIPLMVVNGTYGGSTPLPREGEKVVLQTQGKIKATIYLTHKERKNHEKAR